jgi:hypothetical protein
LRAEFVRLRYRKISCPRKPVADAAQYMDILFL